MQVCRGGFYAWNTRKKSVRQRQDEMLTEQIKTVYQDSRQTYGSPRIYADLKEAGIPCSQKRIARLMRLCRINALRPRRFVVTTDSDHKRPIAQNLLERTFEAEAPDTRWTADITYLVRHEVACKIVMRSIPDMTGCPITCTLRGNAARQRAV
jgi:putative transposase